MKYSVKVLQLLLWTGVVLMVPSNTSSFAIFQLKTPAYYFSDLKTQQLLQVALAGDLVEAKRLVAQGANPNEEGPRDNRYNRLRLLHYAIAAKNENAVRTLVAVGADPEMKTEGCGRPLLFAMKLEYLTILDLLLELKPIQKLSNDTLQSLLFESVLLHRPKCLNLFLERGAPIDFRDDAGYTILMSAMDVHEYELAGQLLLKGASINIVTAAGMTPAYLVDFHLQKYKPGTPTYNKVLRLKNMMAERGAVFPAPSPAEMRAKRVRQ